MTRFSFAAKINIAACPRTCAIRGACHRLYTTAASRVTPVDLAFDITMPATVKADGQSLVICHGLFGSKQNWRSLAKLFANRLGMPVYTLDLRNHGQSPHAEPHTYAAMAEDISQFFRKQQLDTGVNLLGHSMGGKAVMALALNSELNAPLRTLISVDMSPAKGKISPEFASYAESMIEVEDARVNTKAEADKILQKVEPILETRQFLLTNTVTKKDAAGTKYIGFRIPLPLLLSNVKSIGDFPYMPPPPESATSPSWVGPTLFLKGEHSRYLNRHNIPIAQAFFPNMRLETLDAGHWVHAERPAQTVDLIEKFVRDGA